MKSSIKEDPIADILKKIAPGTPIREGLDNILKAKTGALLLITDDSKMIEQVVDGGFFINEEYTSAKLYEYALIAHAFPFVNFNPSLVKLLTCETAYGSVKLFIPP